MPGSHPAAWPEACLPVFPADERLSRVAGGSVWRAEEVITSFHPEAPERARRLVSSPAGATGETLARVRVLASSAQTGRSEPEKWPRYGLPVFVSGYEGYRLHKLD